MLTLVIGRAGTGKTSYVMGDFKNKISKNMSHIYYIVPEQYSHNAERQLLRICGDTLTLHGEVLSFSRLCSRVFSETGGLSAKLLDDGGRILRMSRAVDAVANKLSIFSKAERKTDFLERLVSAVKEFKSCCISPDDLEAASQRAASPLREKLCDLALIFGAYDSYFNNETADPDDRLSRLVKALPDSTIFEAGHIYFDGFTDFTAQELRVIAELIRMNADMTVCLTCDELHGLEEIFESARKTAVKLMRFAAESGVKVELIEKVENDTVKSEQLRYLEKNLFLHHSERFDGAATCIELYKATAPDAECEYAASKVLELVRSGYRWRDISVAVCDYSSYGTLAENVFEKYEVPIYISKKSELSHKPPIALAGDALDIIINGWDCDAVCRYLKTGLTGLSSSDCDALENYALLWNLRGKIWTREEDWVQPPSGYAGDPAGDDEAGLMRINDIRRTVIGPIKALQKKLAKAESFGHKLRALYEFLDGIGLAHSIEAKAEELRLRGDSQLAEEYGQLWDVLIKAMDQCYEIIGDKQGSNAEFLRLWKLLISQYSIGSIPVSLDRVTLGELSRQRRRDMKCLIVIGASDDVLPKASRGDGLLSDSERREIVGLGVTLSGTAEERLYREMNTIYSTLTLPSDKLIITYPERGFSGGDKRPSFVIKRLQTMFSLENNDALCDYRLYAQRPMFELAASFLNDPTSASAAAAAEYFRTDNILATRLRHIYEAAALSRGKLSHKGSSKLFGHDLVMSASRVDKFYSCHYLYFLQYGLSARPRKPAGFDAPTAGTFMHYILENVTRELKKQGGFSDVTETQCLELTNDYVKKYVEEVLGNFTDKTSRFKYLFDRLKKDAVFVVSDMVRELENSDFTPIDFELEFSDKGDIPPHAISGGEQSVKINGFVDRIDGWQHDGKLYLRIVDYKTGKKSFSLSDVWYGMNMQMLIYLFALQKNGSVKYQQEIIPAGVLYAPARDEILQASRYATDEDIGEQRQKKLKRSGLILGDLSVVEAMERGDGKKYLPVKVSKDAQLTGDSLADLSMLEQLSTHIDKRLLEIAENVRQGSIEAQPYYKNQSDNACLYCDFQAACHFSEKDGDKRRYLKKLKTQDAWALIAGGEQQ